MAHEIGEFELEAGDFVWPAVAARVLGRLGLGLGGSAQAADRERVYDEFMFCGATRAA